MNFKKLAAALMAAALCVTGAGCSRSAENSGNTGDTGNTDGTVSDGGSAREFDTELTAMQLTSDIKIGWNLGNTLDATGGSGLTQLAAFSSARAFTKPSRNLSAFSFALPWQTSAATNSSPPNLEHIVFPPQCSAARVSAAEVMHNASSPAE